MMRDSWHDPFAHDKYSEQGGQAKNQGDPQVNVAFSIVAKGAYKTGDTNYEQRIAASDQWVYPEQVDQYGYGENRAAAAD